GGAVLTLFNAAGVVLGTTSSAITGEFTFAGIPNGDFFLTETDPAGYASTNAIAGAGGVRLDANTLRITTISGVTQYAGSVFLDRQVSVAPAGPNMIAGSVFNDVNGNGVIDGGEAPLANVAITLRDAANNPVAATTTTVTGSFTFAGLASGTYTLTETD